LLSDPLYQEEVAGALFAGTVQYLAQRHAGRIPAEIALNHRRSATAAKEWAQRWRAVKDRSREEVVLYFLGATNRDDYLVPELRRLADSDGMGEAGRVRAALGELISGPGDKSALLTSVPRSLTVTGVSVAGKSVRVCLETGLDGFGLGERGEELALYAIVNTVSEIVPGALVSVVVPNGEPAISGGLGATEEFTARPDLLCPGRE
jgi:spore germination protein GerM